MGNQVIIAISLAVNSKAPGLDGEFEIAPSPYPPLGRGLR